jgi:tripartite ATP-independent transporter DctP family solute receptor
MLRSLLAAALALAVAAPWIAPAPAAAQAPVTLRLGYVSPAGSLHDLVANEFARRANAELAGKVEVKVFADSALGTDEQMIRGIRNGEVEMFLPGAVMSTLEPKFGVFEMPYLFADRRHVRRVVESKAVQEQLFATTLPKGMRILGVWEYGFRQITNNVRPVAKPDDLKGLKIRVPSGVWRVRMFQTYGASPVARPWKVVYDELRSGGLDGQESAFQLFMSDNIQDVQKYVSLTDHVYTPAFLVINEDVWQRLPADVQKRVAKLGWEMGDWCRKEGERLDKELRSKLPPTIKVNEVDKDAFVRASSVVYEQFASEVPGGAALVKMIQSLR